MEAYGLEALKNVKEEFFSTPFAFERAFHVFSVQPH
jgi:hypothetical protein